jgi:hypothetical protein
MAGRRRAAALGTRVALRPSGARDLAIGSDGVPGGGESARGWLIAGNARGRDRPRGHAEVPRGPAAWAARIGVGPGVAPRLASGLVTALAIGRAPRST